MNVESRLEEAAAGERSAAEVVAEAALVGHSPIKTLLHGLRALRVSGDDAIDFLHAQFSADCRALPYGARLVTAWCTPKGRALYLPQLIRVGDGMVVLVPATQAGAFVRRLRLFVLRARVEISDLGASHGVLLVATPAASARPACFVEAEGSTHASSADGRRHWFIAPRTLLSAAWAKLALPAVGDNAARLVTLRALEPELDVAVSDAFLPQELSLDRSSGVSFDKGCYPGQEIVARVRYRGSVKRRLAHLACAGAQPPAAGARLVGGGDATLGTVLLAARASATALEMLAVLDVDAAAARLADSGEAVTPLPS